MAVRCWYFIRWEQTNVTLRILDHLREQVRTARPQPKAVAGIIDSQSVKAADTVGTHSRGYDVGNKSNGRNDSSSPTAPRPSEPTCAGAASGIPSPNASTSRPTAADEAAAAAGRQCLTGSSTNTATSWSAARGSLLRR